MKKIKTFENACKALKISSALPDLSAIPEIHQAAILAHYKLIIITQALNNNWIPDWNNTDEYKYYSWWDMEKNKNNPSGFRLFFVYYCYTYARVGSRLCFKTRDIAQYAATQFKDLYQSYMK